MLRFAPFLPAVLAAMVAAPVFAADADERVPPADADAGAAAKAVSPAVLPRWRGFNLTNRQHLDWSNGPFEEEDFRLVARLGFDFVRLPMDYRTWIEDGDWERIDEAALADIDRAVAWGERYGLHVCLNFHRAPGFTVSHPPEARDLWTDTEAQRVCALHWAAFARRYRGVPPARLSFNLLNEPPAAVTGAAYAEVIAKLVHAIREVDPDRLVIADGLRGGVAPCPELVPLGVAQATRGYVPVGLTHYRAPWVQGSETMPAPTWPVPALNAYLYGPERPDWAGPVVLDGPFPHAATLRVRVGIVSRRGRLVVRADDTPVLDLRLQPGPGEGEWVQSVFRPEYQVYQNRYDRDFACVLPAGTRRVTVKNAEGDWLTVVELGVRPVGDPRVTEAVLHPGVAAWGAGQAAAVRYVAGPDRPAFESPWRFDRDTLRREYVEPWHRLQTEGVGVIVGEFGAYHRTPHAVVLRWMEDNLANWKEAGWGWALWNFRGPFGILDSGRDDVAYEAWEGHQLDREMLELLQRY